VASLSKGRLFWSGAKRVFGEVSQRFVGAPNGLLRFGPIARVKEKHGKRQYTRNNHFCITNADALSFSRIIIIVVAVTFPKMSYRDRLVEVTEFDSRGQHRFFSYFVTEKPTVNVLATADRIRRFASWTRTIESVGVIWDRESGAALATIIVDDRSFALRTDLDDIPRSHVSAGAPFGGQSIKGL